MGTHRRPYTSVTISSRRRTLLSFVLLVAASPTDVCQARVPPWSLTAPRRSWHWRRSLSNNDESSSNILPQQSPNFFGARRRQPPEEEPISTQHNDKQDDERGRRTFLRRSRRHCQQVVERTTRRLQTFDNFLLLPDSPSLKDIGTYYGLSAHSVAHRTAGTVTALDRKRGRRGMCGQHSVQDVSVKTKRRLLQPPSLESFGVYYGISPQTLSTEAAEPKPKKVRMRDAMTETLSELKTMRQEMEALRRELQDMKQRAFPTNETDEQQEDGAVGGMAALLRRRKRRAEFDRIGAEVEQWAQQLLNEEEGWSEVECSKMFRASINKEGTTRAFIKWMKDSRGDKYGNPEDDKLYPCIKLTATLDAPISSVCAYLAQEEHMGEYNDLVVQHEELETITPHSKICWGATPQILFIKPREFITFCHYRWLRDGTQVVINQACKEDYRRKTRNTRELPKAHAIRGANFIRPHSDYPGEKTVLEIIAHANPGDDVPKWAMKTAVNAMAPIEPFKLCHKINQGVIQQFRRDQEQQSSAEDAGGDGTMMVAANPAVAGPMCQQSKRPAGLSQMGYACFWPNGGAGIEVAPTPPASPALSVETGGEKGVDGDAEESSPPSSEPQQAATTEEAQGDGNLKASAEAGPSSTVLMLHDDDEEEDES